MRRVSVVGNSGSGKTQLAQRLASALSVPCVELDAIHHLPGWTPIDPVEFVASVSSSTAADGWVVDGNYRLVVMDGPVWERADTVVWLDLPRLTVARQIVWRSFLRLVTRRSLWNGNRERLRALLSWDPAVSIIRWSWTRHDEYRQRYGAAMAAPEYSHLRFVRLQSRREVEEFLALLGPGSSRAACPGPRRGAVRERLAVPGDKGRTRG